MRVLLGFLVVVLASACTTVPTPGPTPRAAARLSPGPAPSPSRPPTTTPGPAAASPTTATIRAATATPSAATTPSDLPAGVVTIQAASGSSTRVRVEIAATDANRARGLMQRPSMPEDAGMLFVFPAETNAAFWMKDTLIPLSIAFIAPDGRIVDIQDMQPLSTDLHHPAASYRYALEVNQGFFARNGIRVGDRVELPAGL